MRTKFLFAAAAVCAFAAAAHAQDNPAATAPAQPKSSDNITLELNKIEKPGAAAPMSSSPTQRRHPMRPSSSTSSCSRRTASSGDASPSIWPPCVRTNGR